MKEEKMIRNDTELITAINVAFQLPDELEPIIRFYVYEMPLSPPS